MKNTVLLFFLLSLFEQSFAQLSHDGSPDNIFILSVGATDAYMNNSAFESWAAANYNKKVTNEVNIYADLTFIFTKWDFGVHIGSANPFSTDAVEFGRRLTSQKSKISSFLNFEFGQLISDYSDLTPIGYKPTPDQQGKKLMLQYELYYFGLTSKNYFNSLHFRIGKNRKMSINSGFFTSIGYMPQKPNWQYGYNTTSFNLQDSDTQFHGVNIPGIPKPNNVFVQGGVFIGIGN